MGINRRNRNRTSEGDKFTLARIMSAKYEAKTLDNLVDQDMDLLYESAGDFQSWEDTRESDAVPDAILYELGILYDTPLVVDDVLPIEPIAIELVEPVEQDADWDIVSEVSEWDLVNLDGGFSDDDSWG